MCRPADTAEVSVWTDLVLVVGCVLRVWNKTLFLGYFSLVPYNKFSVFQAHTCGRYHSRPPSFASAVHEVSAVRTLGPSVSPGSAGHGLEVEDI